MSKMPPLLNILRTINNPPFCVHAVFACEVITKFKKIFKFKKRTQKEEPIQIKCLPLIQEPKKIYYYSY